MVVTAGTERCVGWLTCIVTAWLMLATWLMTAPMTVVETRPGQESPQVGYTISPECSLHEKVQSNCPSVGIPLWDATFAIANVPSCTGKESDIFSPKISMEMCWVTIQNLHYTVNVTCS